MTQTYRPTAATHQAGAHTLPREYYTSEALLAEERERAVLKKNRRKLARQANALIAEQARP